LIDKKLFKNIDWVLMIFFGLLLVFSLIVLASASSNLGTTPYYYFKRQLMWIAVGLVVFCAVSLFDYRQLLRGNKFIYIAMLVLLVGVLFVPTDDGVHRWYDLKIMMFQPSELAKFSLVLFAACYFSKNPDMSEGILPVYPLTKGISQKEMRSWQHAVKELYSQAEDFLDKDIIERNRLCDLAYALENIHFPKEKQKLLEAKYRLVFDELLVLQAGLLASRQSMKDIGRGIAFSETADTDEYIRSLPYPLTGAQKRCINEIENDLESSRIMNRLVQGDVGSGKTAVAEIAMYKAVKSGYQAVLMAPTEILARQHFEGISKSFEVHGINVGILTGSMKQGEKRDVLERLVNGDIQILVGTHAVIQPEVHFDRLGLVITDEQHRFGVKQRIKLKEKGENPNILVMTATPIPRTLAVVLYGDLDVSVIDEMPPGRQK